MILVPVFEIPHRDRLAKNVKSQYVQVIPRSTVYFRTSDFVYDSTCFTIHWWINFMTCQRRESLSLLQIAFCAWDFGLLGDVISQNAMTSFLLAGNRSISCHHHHHCGSHHFDSFVGPSWLWKTHMSQIWEDTIASPWENWRASSGTWPWWSDACCMLCPPPQRSWSSKVNVYHGHQGHAKHHEV